MTKLILARIILAIHLVIAILSVIRVYGVHHQLESPFIPDAERVFFFKYFNRISITVWVGFLVSAFLYYYSKPLIAILVSIVSILFYFYG